MRVRKPVSAKTKAKGLTPKGKKRLGRPPTYLNRQQLENPSGFLEPIPEHLRISTLDIIHGVLAQKRLKFDAELARDGNAAAVARTAKRLQRIKLKLAKTEGIDRLK